MGTAAVTLPRTRRRSRAAREGGRASVPDVYYVKRIDHSRLRREVDPEKRRECYSLLGLGILVFIFCLLFGWQHLQCVRYGYQIQELKGQRAALDEWNRELRADEASLVDPQRIDEFARKNLGLAPPGPQQVIHIGPASSAPATSPVLAQVVPAFDSALGRAVGSNHRQP